MFLPEAGFFWLCVDGPFGPVDIGVHGKCDRVLLLGLTG